MGDTKASICNERTIQLSPGFISILAVPGPTSSLAQEYAAPAIADFFLLESQGIALDGFPVKIQAK
ncbi:hypothetical protein LLE49_12380 [Alicyclobacillus tolerans]|uniref:hypothetical protein n=1 Tax=Alicyclobacillus tolerans TaxID=90970 RepID=UPI001F1C1D4B|nr:hypothetical protein [Alicyclobacillus tolerans]MCF8565513.1 hypothetical protein [Alicyclobacillus tolerans]